MPDDAVRAVAELAASQHGAFTRRQAAANKLLSWRGSRPPSATDGWSSVRPACSPVAGHPDTWEQRLIVATLAGGGHGVASHRSAARLHGLDGFDHDAHVEVTVDNRHRLRLPTRSRCHDSSRRPPRARARRRRAPRNPSNWSRSNPRRPRIGVRHPRGQPSTDRCSSTRVEHPVDPSDRTTLPSTRPGRDRAVAAPSRRHPARGRCPRVVVRGAPRRMSR